MTAYLMPVPKARFYNSAGNAPLSGGLVYTYEAGSNIPLPSYTDSSGNTANTNPVVLDGAGEADIWLIGNYKIVLETADGTQRWSVDNVSDIGTAIANIFGQILNIYAGVSGGTPSDFTLSPSPTLTSYMIGQQIRFAVFQDNTSPTTMNINNLGAKAILKFNGSQLVPLVAGDLKANTLAEIEYDGTQFELLNVRPFSESASTTVTATLNLDATNGVYVPLSTGGVAVTAITLAQGQYRRGIALASFTITASSNILTQGGVNVIVNTGDSIDFWGEGSGIVRVIVYTSPTVARNYISGLGLGAPGGGSIFGISAGQAVDSTNSFYMNLLTAYTKTMASFAVGTGNGSLDTGTKANSTWYAVFLIKRLDTGVVDVLTSLSDTAPTLPTNYTIGRRIGFILINSSGNIDQFQQIGDFIEYKTAISIATTCTTARTLISLTVPKNMRAKFRLSMGAASNWQAFIQPTYETDGAPSVSASPGITLANAGNIIGACDTEMFVDNSSQIAARSTIASTSICVSVYGYYDTRGRDF